MGSPRQRFTRFRLTTSICRENRRFLVSITRHWLSHINEFWPPSHSLDSGSNTCNHNQHNILGARGFWAERFLYLEATKTKIKLGD